MSVSATVVLVAAVLTCVAAVSSLIAAALLLGSARRLERGVEALRGEAVPLVSGARHAVDHAATELARVEAVLQDTEAVTAQVESASRLAHYAFTNPIVKLLAWRAGLAGAARRFATSAHESASPPVTLSPRRGSRSYEARHGELGSSGSSETWRSAG